MQFFDHPSKLHAAVIGYGGAGVRRLRAMQAAGMTPVAVVEPSPERLAVAAQDFPGIETYSNVADLLQKSSANVVTIVTPHNTHAPLAMQCIEAGRHVVSEKPMAIITAECDALITAARERGVMLSAFHNRHWDGCILRALAQVRERGVIGEVFRVDARVSAYGKPVDEWRSRRSLSGGILYDWGVHLLDYILQVVDSEVTEVSGFSKTGFWAEEIAWKTDANEDAAYAAIRFKSGAWATLNVSQLDTNPHPGLLEIVGTRGSYTIVDLERYRLVRYETGARIEEEGPHDPPQFEKYFENVAAHLTRGEPLVITPEWARRPVHILDLAGQSAREGRTLPAVYP